MCYVGCVHGAVLSAQSSAVTGCLGAGSGPWWLWNETNNLANILLGVCAQGGAGGPQALSVFHCSLLGFVGMGGTRGCAMLGGVLLMAR